MILAANSPLPPADFGQRRFCGAERCRCGGSFGLPCKRFKYNIPPRAAKQAQLPSFHAELWLAEGVGVQRATAVQVFSPVPEAIPGKRQSSANGMLSIGGGGISSRRRCSRRGGLRGGGRGGAGGEISEGWRARRFLEEEGRVASRRNERI